MSGVVARIVRALLLGTLIALAGSTTAVAASVGARYSCYTSHRGAHFTLLGSGFTPESLVHVHLGEHTLPDVRADLEGRIQRAYALPGVSGGRHAQAFRLTASDGMFTARGVLRVTKFDVRIVPASGRPSRAVRLGLNGWFGKTVWLHYVAPHAHHSTRDKRIGRSRGACGGLDARLKHLYPFRPRAGVWHLQFDTHRTYRAHRTPSIVIAGRVSVGR